MNGYYKKMRLSKGAKITIIICAAVIAILVIAIIYAGGFIDKSPSDNPSIAQQNKINGTNTDTQTIEVTRDGKINKSLNEMTLDEIWVNDPREKTEVKALYISDSTIGDTDLFNSLIDLCDTTELNALVLNVKNDYGEITSDLGIPLASEIGSVSAYIEDMKTLVARLHEHDIYAIGRICTFKDTVLAENRPEYACTNNDGTVYHDGNGYAWINPYNRESWEYFIDIAEICADIGFDEVQFDQMRVPTGIGYTDINYSFDSQTVSKTDIISEFAEYAYKALVHSGMFVSITVNGACILHESDGELIGQDYTKLAKWSDYICPMCYPSDYNSGEYNIENPDSSPYEFNSKLLSDSATQLKTAASDGHTAEVRPWLQGYSADWLENYTPYLEDQYKAQIQAVYDNGYSQWAFWCSSGEYIKNAFMNN